MPNFLIFVFKMMQAIQNYISQANFKNKSIQTMKGTGNSIEILTKQLAKEGG